MVRHGKRGPPLACANITYIYCYHIFRQKALKLPSISHLTFLSVQGGVNEDHFPNMIQDTIHREALGRTLRNYVERQIHYDPILDIAIESYFKLSRTTHEQQAKTEPLILPFWLGIWGGLALTIAINIDARQGGSSLPCLRTLNLPPPNNFFKIGRGGC